MKPVLGRFPSRAVAGRFEEPGRLIAANSHADVGRVLARRKGR